MHWNRHDSRIIGALLLLVAATVAAPAATGAQERDGTAGDATASDDTRHRTRIHIERHGGAGEEGLAGHRMVFIDEDGEPQEIESESGGFAWIDGEHGPHAERHHFGRATGFGLGKGGFLGVSTTHLTRELRAHFGAPQDAGVMISRIADDSAAFSAGLAVGDILTAVDGEAVDSPTDLMRAIRSREEGDTVTLEIYRSGQIETLAAVLGKTEGPAFAFHGEPPFGRRGRFGPALRVHCSEEDGDCDVFLRRRLEVCEGGGECEVDIRCADGSCECTVNGAEADCEGLHPDHDDPDDD
jgi:hypothetical protein